MDLLHRIPVTQRQVWIARRLDGLEDAAIADLFGIPSSAIPPMLDAADRAITSLLESDPAFRGVDHQAFIATILQETEPPATDVERLLASPRVRRALDAAARPRPTWSWRAPAPWMPATALVAGLAAALLWAGHVGFPFTNHGHPPPPTTPTAPASGDDAVTLLAAAEPTSLTLPTGIQVRYHGNGQLSGAPQAPHIDWRSGVLELSIPPHEGLELVVDTEEAQVEVVGTHYSVTRDALGTRVSVARGQVQVRCHHGDEASHGDPVERRLQSEQGLTCLPGRDAGSTQSRYRKSGFLPTTSAGILYRIHRRRSPDIRRLISHFFMTPVIDLQGSFFHRKTLDPAGDFPIVHHTKGVEVLIVHPIRQHKMQEHLLRDPAPPGHLFAGT